MRFCTELLLLWGSFLGSWFFLGSSLLFRSSLLLSGSLLLRGSLLSFDLLDFLSFGLLGLLRFLRELHRPIDSPSGLCAARNQSFSRQHLLDRPPDVALYLLGVVSHLVVGHDVLEDGFPGGSSLLRGLLRLGGFLSWSCCVGHDDDFLWGRF